jgi:putative SOS response-associated peptidase YedK
MCGRYASSRRPEDLVEEFEIEATDGDGPGADPVDVGGDFNVAPTKPAPVVLERLPREPVVAEQTGPDLDETGTDRDGDEPLEPGPEQPGATPEPVRWLRMLRWGLVPSWAKDRSIGNRMINARAETLLEKPAYRRAAVSRRCLVPADGWYEWQVSPVEKDAKGKPRKQPFFMHPADGSVAAIAGVYELWRDPSRHADDPQAWLASYAVLTTAAEPALAAIHDRMPLILPPDRWDTWLDPTERDPDTVRALLQPPDPGRFVAVPVSTRVNAVANNGPELLDPAPLDQLRGVVDPVTGELIGTGEAPLF